MVLPLVRRLTAPVALAAVLIGALACTTDARRSGQQPPAAPEPVSPRGAVTLPFSFTWMPVAGVASPVYRVRVTDAAERVLYEQDVRSTQCPPSSELRAMMADHATFTWTVGVLADEGTDVVARSAAVEFSLR